MGRIDRIARFVRQLIPGPTAEMSDTVLRDAIAERCPFATHVCGFTSDYNLVTFMVAALLMGDEWLMEDDEARRAVLDPIDPEDSRGDALDARLAEVAGPKISPIPAV
jgi:hypothetical protein